MEWLRRLIEALFGGRPPERQAPSVARKYDLRSADGVRAVQQLLSRLGYLDPPPDGKFGSTTQWAIGEVLSFDPIETPDDERLTRELYAARDLIITTSGDDLASRVSAAMLRRGHWICRHPQCVNIAYVKGMDVFGGRTNDAPDEWNDVCVVFSVDSGGAPRVIGRWQATVDPGRVYVQQPINAKGAARIKPGQYKAWRVGTHRGQHEALVQTGGVVTVYRDANRDYSGEGDAEETGYFGINQHGGYDLGLVGRASAGCLVRRFMNEHAQFMNAVKQDARYKFSRGGYVFMTSILTADDLEV